VDIWWICGQAILSRSKGFGFIVDISYCYRAITAQGLNKRAAKPHDRPFPTN